MRPLLRVTCLALLVSFAAACQEQPTQPEVQTLRFEIVAGDVQEGAPGEELPEPLVVRVVNNHGWGVPRELVNFRVVEGDGTMWAGTSLTDWRGYARDYWTLGTEGAQSVEVRSVDPSIGTKEVHASFTATFATVDADGDGFASDVDCDDGDPAINPGAAEISDGIDNDCDGEIDEGLPLDADGDGFTDDVDCDDADASVYPGAPELADGKDNDCDGDVDEDFSEEICDGLDNDGDGTTDEGLPYCVSGAPAPNTDGATCDNGWFDLDGDPLNGCESDTLFPDADADGFTSDVDCDDTDPTVNPGADEVLDGVDNDCDGDVDEGILDYTLQGARIDNFRTSGCPALDQCFDFSVTPLAGAGLFQMDLLQRIGTCAGTGLDTDILSVNSGVELTNTVSLHSNSPDIVTICTIVDPLSSVAEDDETNNRLEVDIRLSDFTIVREEFVS